MEFNSSAATFSKKDHFSDAMKRFVSEEAAIFTPEGEEAASASMDRTAEKLVRFSADKNKANVKEQKRILGSIRDKKEQIMQSEKIQGETMQGESKFEGSSGTGFSKEAGASSSGASGKEKKELSSAEKSAKKTKSKETRKAATKTAVANFLKAKADMSNDLVSDKVSGDAMKD